ncbi:MAG: TIGR01244 family phosphatase [Rhodobacteraceae bacterium]|nr:TIGR01244 family phosphatase [Paracoccaceae bacterium]
MDARALTPTHSVAPQLMPEDLALAKDAGFTTIICNRPDEEVPPDLSAEAMRGHAEALGLNFVVIPFRHGSLTMDEVNAQRNALEAAKGPVLAYCASGNRCSILWALTVAGQIPTDEIIARGAAAGYQLEGLRGQLDAMAG